MQVIINVTDCCHHNHRPLHTEWTFTHHTTGIIVKGEYIMLTLKEGDVYTFALVLKDSKGRVVQPDGEPDFTQTSLNGVVDLFLDPGNQSGKVSFLDGPGTAQLVCVVDADPSSDVKQMTALADLTCLAMSAVTAEFVFTPAIP